MARVFAASRLQVSILGVDLDTKQVTAVHISYDGDLIADYNVTFNGKKALDRARRAVEPLLRIPWTHPSIVCLERPAGSSVRVAMDIQRIQGLVLSLLQNRPWWDGPEVWEMLPPEWKKLAGLAGNASKTEISDHVPAHHKEPHWKQDHCDAYCIAMAALEFNKRGLSHLGER